jgi:hypothetical protein
MRIFNFFKSIRIPQQSVTIYFVYGEHNLGPLHLLEQDLRDLLEGKNIGYHDGHEIAMDYSDGILYLYGSNAEDLFKTIKSTLLNVSWMHGAKVNLAFGDVLDEATKTIDFILE